MSSKHDESSKFLSYVLRHEPQAIGLTLDREGWAEIDALISGTVRAGRMIDAEEIRHIVASSDKKRFVLSDDGRRIRAVQGHSIGSVVIEREPTQPPEFLYHGTATRFLASIRVEGLIAGLRQHVHLSADRFTAMKVGQRHGTPSVLIIEAQRMHSQGFLFFQADNGVWLTEHVPTTFIAT